MNRLLPLSICLALVTACGQAAEPAPDTAVRHAPFASSTATDLGTLGGSTSYAADINNPGVVVGYATTETGLIHAFRWTARAGMTDLGTLPGGTQSGAVRILNSGRILGWSETATGRRIPVQWSAHGEIRALDIARLPEVSFMEPSDFNERGEVVGSGFSNELHGWYWSRETGTIDLNDRVPSCSENSATAINASGLLVGTHCALSTGTLRSYTLRVHGLLHDLSVGDDIYNANSVGFGINQAGTVAGWLDPHGNITTSATTWSGERGFTLLPNLPSGFPSGYATAVNNRGVAVGVSWDESADTYVAIAWPSATRLVRLDGGVPQFAVATAINDNGLVVGAGASAAGPSRALLWELSAGRTESVTSPGGAAALPGGALTRAAVSGAAACLTDRRVMASRAGLAGCVMGVK